MLVILFLIISCGIKVGNPPNPFGDDSETNKKPDNGSVDIKGLNLICSRPSLATNKKLESRITCFMEDKSKKKLRIRDVVDSFELNKNPLKSSDITVEVVENSSSIDSPIVVVFKGKKAEAINDFVKNAQIEWIVKKGKQTETISANHPGQQGTMIYNGEDFPFASFPLKWGSNNSKLVENNISPHSGKSHLRATINLTNWWGGASYMISNGSANDWSKFKTLDFYAKMDKTIAIVIQLCGTIQNETHQYMGSPKSLILTTSYKVYSINMSELASTTELTKVTGIIFGIKQEGTGTYNIDIDDISVK